jgi:hypothetical protein
VKTGFRTSSAGVQPATISADIAANKEKRFITDIFSD